MGKNNVFNFWEIVFKMYIFEIVTSFLAQWLSNQLNFSKAVPINKIHVFDEAFVLLTIRMPMATKLSRVVTCCDELSPTNMHDTLVEWSCGITWQIKFMSPPSEDVWTPNKASCWLSIRGSQTWPLDQMTKARSRDRLKILYLHFRKVYSLNLTGCWL